MGKFEKQKPGTLWSRSSSSVPMEGELEPASEPAPDTVTREFSRLCSGGDLARVKAYFTEHPILRDKADDLFRIGCLNGHLHVVRWLLTVAGNRIRSNKFTPFKWACQAGHLEVAQWLHRLGNLDPHAKNHEAFIQSCRQGHLKVAKWLLKIGATPSAQDCRAFVESCGSGHLKVVKWLDRVTNLLTAKIRARGANVAMERGHLALIQWFHKRGMDMRAEHDTWFANSCFFGHLPVAKWLRGLGADVRAHNDFGFIMACDKGHVGIAEWLATQCADYRVTVTGGQIVDYRIRDPVAEYMAGEMGLVPLREALQLKPFPRPRHEVCVLCLELEKERVVTECGHHYCLDCVANLVHPTGPPVSSRPVWTGSWTKKNRFRCPHCGVPTTVGDCHRVTGTDGDVVGYVPDAVAGPVAGPVP